MILDIIMKIWPIITLIMTNLFLTCCPNSNKLICKLNTVFNGKTCLWTFLHTYCIKQNGISNNFCYIVYKIVENHPQTKFSINLVCFCLFMSIYASLI